MVIQMLSEIWKTTHISDEYEVSNTGRVRRIKGKGMKYGDSPRLLNPSVLANGYPHVNLKKKVTTLHRLVSTAFLGDRPEGLVTNHKDGNKLNNSIENLEYVTYQYNSRHAFSNGLQKPPMTKGSEIGTSKLNERAVVVIKKLIPIMKNRTIAKIFCVTPSCICDIARGRSWRHLDA